MTFFKVDVAKIESNIASFDKISQALSDDVKLCCDTLMNSDSYWNDPNNLSFKMRVKNDFYGYIEFKDNLQSKYNELKRFIDRISLICKKYGCKNVSTLKYDDGRLNDCLLYLEQCIEILNIDLYKLNSLKYEVKGNLSDDLMKKINGIKSLINDIEVLKKDIIDFTSDIKNTVFDSRIRKSKLDSKNFKSEAINYKWRVCDPNNK